MLGERFLSLGFGLWFLPGETQTAVGGGAAGSWPGGEVVGGSSRQRRGRRRCGRSVFCEREGRGRGSVTNRHVVVVVRVVVRWLRRLFRMRRSRSSIELNMVFLSSKANLM